MVPTVPTLPSVAGGAPGCTWPESGLEGDAVPPCIGAGDDWVCAWAIPIQSASAEAIKNCFFIFHSPGPFADVKLPHTGALPANVIVGNGAFRVRGGLVRAG